MTDITELAQLMKAAAVRAKTATEEYASGHMSVSVCYAECEEFNRLTDGPDNILALVEALEKAQADLSQMTTFRDNAVKKIIRLGTEIAELESRTITVKLLKDHVDDADLFGWGVVVVPLEALKEACADVGVTVEITDAGIKAEAE
ncbi:TPA: hypothetical protein ACTY5A_001074 [Klebsiella aerogenes]